MQDIEIYPYKSSSTFNNTNAFPWIMIQLDMSIIAGEVVYKIERFFRQTSLFIADLTICIYPTLLHKQVAAKGYFLKRNTAG